MGVTWFAQVEELNLKSFTSIKLATRPVRVDLRPYGLRGFQTDAFDCT